MNTWCISDTHFGHAKILDYEPSRRVLGDTIEAHDAELIRRWNAVVAPNDLVIHCGDVGLTKRTALAAIVAQLAGRKILVRGNHDRFSDSQYVRMGFERVAVAMASADCAVTYCHRPQDAESAGWLPGRTLVHGHTHGHPLAPELATRLGDAARCVSVEAIGFAPVRLEDLVNGGGP